MRPDAYKKFEIEDAYGKPKRLTKCPMLSLNPDIEYYVHLYNDYKAGHLPYGGGALDQPAGLMKRIRIIGGVVEEVLSEKMKAKP